MGGPFDWFTDAAMRAMMRPILIAEAEDEHALQVMGALAGSFPESMCIIEPGPTLTLPPPHGYRFGLLL